MMKTNMLDGSQLIIKTGGVKSRPTLNQIMKQSLLSIVLLSLLSCSNPPAQPVVNSDTAWRFIFIRDHWETFITKGRYFDTSAIVDNKIKTIRDSAFQAYVAQRDSTTKRDTAFWVPVDKNIVGIKLK
jgi:hypothetical protein